jgi:hypothetical protein
MKGFRISGPRKFILVGVIQIEGSSKKTASRANRIAISLWTSQPQTITAQTFKKNSYFQPLQYQADIDRRLGAWLLPHALA